jgi:UDP-N-acetyl-D-galactosamine dehydrogenase
MVKKVIQKMLLNGIDVPNSTVGVLGITFKENCPDVRNSKIIDVVSELKSWGVNVVVVDPWADPIEVERAHDISLGNISSSEKVDSLIVAVGHDVSLQDLWSFGKGPKPVLADVKSLYDRQSLTDYGFSIFRL